MAKYNELWYKNLKKSTLTPPNWVFGVVWPVLYVFLGISWFLVYQRNGELKEFYIQLLLNLIWTRIFFYYKQVELGFVIICAILFFTKKTYTRFLKINAIAAYLLIPYMIWLTFAGYLNGYIMLNN
jgi:tryptophan-rich sensory protein